MSPLGGAGGAGGAGDAPAGAGVPEVLWAQAPSNHYVEVKFAAAVDASWEDPGRFEIIGPDSTTLVIQEVDPAIGDATKLLMRTGAQQPVEYTLRISSERGDSESANARTLEVTFLGTTVQKPSVQTAVALSYNEVLVLFGDTTSATRFRAAPDYAIDGMQVVSVRIPTDPPEGAILETDNQDDRAYTVTVSHGDDELFPDSATFQGIASNDQTGPTVRRVSVVSATSVLVEFTEPLDRSALCHGSGQNANACAQLTGSFEILDDQGRTHSILEGSLAFLDTHVLLTTATLEYGVAYHLQVDAPELIVDAAGNAFREPASASAMAFTRPAAMPVSPNDLEPRVAGAMSTGNTSVVVAFNKAMADGAAHASNYVIVTGNVNAEAGGLNVVDARFLTTDGTRNGPLDRSRVELTTLSQSTVEYVLSVIGVFDVDGRALTPQRLGSDGNGLVLLGGNQAHFAGTGPSGAIVDTDGDGLSDAEEQLGWNVTVYLTDGTVTTREVTSDPTLSDTDADGLSDRMEKMLRTDPRDNDTDDDTVFDEQEATQFLSSPIKQDTDGDGLSDPRELRLFKTSPILADTDGDAFDDAEELMELNRNPRIADLPVPIFNIFGTALRLDERYSYTDATGSVVSEDHSSQSSLTSADSTSATSSSTKTNQGFFKVGASVKTHANTEVEFGGTGPAKGKFAAGAEFGLSAEGGATFTRTTDTSNTTARNSQEAYQDSVSRGRQLSTSQTVSREILGASVDTLVTIENGSDVAFTIGNVELTAMTAGRTRTEFVPVGTLVAGSELSGGGSSDYNIGPDDPPRGPLVFSSRDVFPSVVEDLMRDPRSVLFAVANYDVTDEYGRNLAFIRQDVLGRTFTLTIDHGDGKIPQRYNIATNGSFGRECSRDCDFGTSGANCIPLYCTTDADCPTSSCQDVYLGGFDAEGNVVGVPLDYVLRQVLGLVKNPKEPNAIVAGRKGLASTFAVGDDIQVVPVGTDGLDDRRIVILAGANGVLDTPPNNNASGEGENVTAKTIGYETSLTCDTNTEARIVEPLDGDGVISSHPSGDDEWLVGQCCLEDGSGCDPDWTCQSDSDCALCTPEGGCEALWCIREPVSPGTALIGPGPNGILDSVVAGDEEYAGPGTICDADADCPSIGGKICCAGTSATSCGTTICQSDADCADPATPQCVNRPDATCGGSEVLVRFENSIMGDPNRFWIAFTSDDKIPVGENFGQALMRPHEGVTLAFGQDIDRDGLFKREEDMYGSSDRKKDSDGDELDDFTEIRDTWEVRLPETPVKEVYSDARFEDSDFDGVRDDVEKQCRTDPRLRDTDGDGLTDGYELGCGMCCKDVTVRPGTGTISYALDPMKGQPPAFSTVVTMSDPNEIAVGDFLRPTEGAADEQIRRVVSVDGTTLVIESPFRTAPKSESGNTGSTFEILPKGSCTAPGRYCSTNEQCTTIGMCCTDSEGTQCDDDALCDEHTDCSGDYPTCTVGTFTTCLDPCNEVCPPEDDGLYVGADPPARLDPRDPDSDGDTLPDGYEIEEGLNPLMDDADQYVDTDQDGLTDSEEIAGWSVEVSKCSNSCAFAFDGVCEDPSAPSPSCTKHCLNDPSVECDQVGLYASDCGAQYILCMNHRCGGTGIPCYENSVCSGSWECVGQCVNAVNENATCSSDGDCTRLGNCDPGTDCADCVPTPETYHVYSDPLSGDTDYDGLPDYVEKILKTDPTKPDTDGDGILDYDEFDQFGAYQNLNHQFPGFYIGGGDSQKLGTDPASQDTDGDRLPDDFELHQGWRVLVCGGGAPYFVFSDPLFADTDLDGLDDLAEYLGQNGTPPYDDMGTPDATDPTDPDTDGDGSLDSGETFRTGCGKRVTVTFTKNAQGTSECDIGSLVPSDLLYNLSVEHTGNTYVFKNGDLGPDNDLGLQPVSWFCCVWDDNDGDRNADIIHGQANQVVALPNDWSTTVTMQPGEFLLISAVVHDCDDWWGITGEPGCSAEANEPNAPETCNYQSLRLEYQDANTGVQVLHPGYPCAPCLQQSALEVRIDVED